MNKFFRLVMALIFVAAVAACSTTHTPPISIEQKVQDKGYQIGVEVKRISNYRLNGWSDVDDSHLIMNSGVSQHYLVTLRQSCINLPWAQNIAFTTTVGSLTVSDTVLVRGEGKILDRCSIRSIHELERIN